MAQTKKKSSNYWKKRFLDLEEASNAYGMEAYRKIEPAFDSAQRQIQNEIEKWYHRFAKNNQISIEEARRQLSAKELKEFQWDVHEYIKYGRENAFNQQWMKELENASARVHISRLEALKVRTQQAVEVAFGNELDVIDNMARKVYTQDYYRSIFEMQKGFNIGWDIGTIDQRKLDNLISKPWTADNRTFKDRIWTSKKQMISELHQQLTRTCVLGKAPDEAIEALTRFVDKDIKNKKYAAGRLVMTEQAYFHSVAQKDAFNELDVEKFEIVATLDSHTSPICQEMDGKHLPMSQYEPGVTAPPFHVFCRTVTVPYFEDNFTGQRAARDEEGNTYYVPDDMTYKDWKKSFVNGANGLTNTGNDDKITEETTEHLKRLEKEKFDWLKKENYDIYGDTVYEMEIGFWEEASDGSMPEASNFINAINKKIDDVYEKLGYRNIVDSGQKSYSKKIKGSHSLLDDLKATNPHYEPNSYKWAYNCQRCVPTYEMRRRGFDVVSKPKKKGNDATAKSWRNIFENAVWEKCGTNRISSTIQSITDNMLKYGDGARAEIYVVWSGNRSAHVFVAENEGGIVKFVDPQSNVADASYYFNSIVTTKTEMCRIDNLKTTDLIRECCE